MQKQVCGYSVGIYERSLFSRLNVTDIYLNLDCMDGVKRKSYQKKNLLTMMERRKCSKKNWKVFKFDLANMTKDRISLTVHLVRSNLKMLYAATD